jgi:hypothetical protein
MMKFPMESHKIPWFQTTNQLTHTGNKCRWEDFAVESIFFGRNRSFTTAFGILLSTILQRLSRLPKKKESKKREGKREGKTDRKKKTWQNEFRKQRKND